ncbi:MAG: DUF1326 domain-containing protein [Planctomycetales bacterium]|nr:DUF1326 domain-containing protein [Planctomycetales bacterium]
MHRFTLCAAVAFLMGAASLINSSSQATPKGVIEGDYVEARTCDVYTGPCFANSQVGLTGQEAILAWSIERGSYDGVDLAGLKVAVAVKASGTLGFGGGLVIHPFPVKSVVLVDERADERQREALVAFAREHAAGLADDVVTVQSLPIEMQLDHVEMVAILKAGDVAEIATRKLAGGDCVCTNEVVYYPPLTPVDNYEPAYTLTGRFAGRGLGGRWEDAGTRSAFLATFRYE